MPDQAILSDSAGGTTMVRYYIYSLVVHFMLLAVLLSMPIYSFGLNAATPGEYFVDIVREDTRALKMRVGSGKEPGKSSGKPKKEASMSPGIKAGKSEGKPLSGSDDAKPGAGLRISIQSDQERKGGMSVAPVSAPETARKDIAEATAGPVSAAAAVPEPEKPREISPAPKAAVPVSQGAAAPAYEKPQPLTVIASKVAETPPPAVLPSEPLPAPKEIAPAKIEVISERSAQETRTEKQREEPAAAPVQAPLNAALKSVQKTPVPPALPDSAQGRPPLISDSVEPPSPAKEFLAQKTQNVGDRAEKKAPETTSPEAKQPVATVEKAGEDAGIKSKEFAEGKPSETIRQASGPKTDSQKQRAGGLAGAGTAGGPSIGLSDKSSGGLDGPASVSGGGVLAKGGKKADGTGGGVRGGGRAGKEGASIAKGAGVGGPGGTGGSALKGSGSSATPSAGKNGASDGTKSGVRGDPSGAGNDKVGESAGGKERAGAGGGKPAFGLPVSEAFFYKDIRIELLVEGDASDLGRKLLVKPYPSSASSDRKAKSAEKESGASVETAVIEEETGIKLIKHMFTLEKADKGTYRFVIENQGKSLQNLHIVIKLFEKRPNGRIKVYTVNLLPGRIAQYRFVMPDGIFWDDTDRFSGSIESSNSVIKFLYGSDFMWEEKKD